jgi:hypothetical protein
MARPGRDSTFAFFRSQSGMVQRIAILWKE